MSTPQDSSRKWLRESDANDDFWRNSASTFPHLFHLMYQNGIDTDVTLKIELNGGSKDIECHKLILSAHSPVFRAKIIEQRTKKVSKENQRIITLTNDNPQHFAFFVDMLYWDWSEGNNEYENGYSKSGLTTEILVGVLSLAHKYEACHIFRLAGLLIHSYLKLGVGVDIVKLYTLLKCLPICDVGQVARKYLRTVENCLLGCGEKVFSSDAVLEMTQSDLLEIVQKNELICDEDIIFFGCFNWAKEQCTLKELSFSLENMRSVLGDVIKFIRFPLMDELTLINEVLNTNVLTQEELVELLAYTICRKSLLLKEPPIRFSTESRANPDDEFEIRRLDGNTVTEDLVDFSTPHGFLMTLSKTMLLSGVRIYKGALPSSGNNYQLSLEVGPRNYYCHFNGFCSGPFENQTLYYFTVPPILIPENTPVLIKFSITGGHTYVSQEVVEEVTKEITYWDEEVVTCTFQRSSAVPDGLRQIPTLIFCRDVNSSPNSDHFMNGDY